MKFLDITNAGGACPYQAEGTYRGLPFYFRSRGMFWSMAISFQKDDPEYMKWSDLPHWFYSEKYSDEEYAAGYITNEEANTFIEKSVKMFDKEVKALNGEYDEFKNEAEALLDG